jgi:hypothetical protein
MSSTERVAVVGWNGDDAATDSRIVKFFNWETPSKNLNLKDYDIWVLLPDTIPDRMPSGTIWDALDVEYVHDALLHNTVIYVLGDARRRIDAGSYTRDFLSWLGLSIRWDSARSTVERNAPELAIRFGVTEYIGARRTWDYALEWAVDYSGTLGGSILGRSQTSISKYTLDIFSLCMNRYNRCIAFGIQLSLNKSTGRYQGEWRVETSYGAVIILPGNSDEVVDYLNSFLVEAIGVSLKEQPPPWVETLTVHGQMELDEKLSDLYAKQDEIAGSIAAVLDDRQKLRSPLGVLYQTGTELEVSVLDMLEQLGAVVERPTESNLEDGWLAVETNQGKFEGVLEIKSTKKPQFDSYGTKQLLEWVTRGIQLRTKKYKPIFVGNAALMISHTERKNPFPKNWIEQAKLGDIVALTTSTLFDAYVMHKCVTLASDEFWNRLFSKSGVFAATDLEACSKSNV